MGIPVPRYWIEDSLSRGTWIPDRPIISGIPDSLSCTPDSKAQVSGFLELKLPQSRIPQSKISLIPKIGLPCMGRKCITINFEACRNFDSVRKKSRDCGFCG